MLRIAKWTLPALVFSLAGCGGSSGDLPPSRAPGAISGSAVDGPIDGGTVSVYSLANGAKGDLIAQGLTGKDGSFSIPVVAATQSVLLEVTNGTYLEDADDTSVRIPNDKGLLAIGSFVSGQEAHINITPISHLAAGLASYRIKSGVATGNAVTQANQEISTLFGVDAVATSPRSIRQPAAGQPLDDPLRYGFLLAGLSSYSASLAVKNGAVSHSAFPTIELAHVMYDDISTDGLLDGNTRTGANAAPVPLSFGSTQFSTNGYRNALAFHVLAAANADFNKSGVKSSDLKTLAQSFISTAAPIFPDAGSLNPTAPDGSIQIDADRYYSGQVTLPFASTDKTGVGVASMQLSFPSSSVQFDGDVVNGTLLVDTAKLKNGVNAGVSVVIDNLGDRKQVEYTMKVDNSIPSLSADYPRVTSSDKVSVSGTYTFGFAPVKEINLGDVSATLSGNAIAGKPAPWTATLTLKDGLNSFLVSALTASGMRSTLDLSVVLDSLEPLLSNSLVFSPNVYFVNRDSSCSAGVFSDAPNTTSPIYIRKDLQATGSVRQDSSSLQAAGVPYLLFSVFDRQVRGASYVGLDQVNVNLQYEVDGKVERKWSPVAPIRVGGSFDPNSAYFIVVFDTNTLSSALIGRTAAATHRVLVQVQDAAGNSTGQILTDAAHQGMRVAIDFKFHAVGGNGACDVSVP